MSNQGGPDLSSLLSFGLSIAVLLVLGFGLGWLVDTLVGSLPLFTLIGLALGIVGASLFVYGQMKRYLKE